MYPDYASLSLLDQILLVLPQLTKIAANSWLVAETHSVQHVVRIKYMPLADLVTHKPCINGLWVLLFIRV